MLGAPDREFAVDFDLTFENALNAAVETFLCRLTQAGVKEDKIRRDGDIAQKIHQTVHSIVVKCDVTGIVLAERIKLRPAAGGILRFKNIINALENRLLITLVFGYAEGSSQEPYFVSCGAIIEGALKCFRISCEWFKSCIGIFGPTALPTLPGQNIIGDSNALAAPIPVVGLFAVLGPLISGLAFGPVCRGGVRCRLRRLVRFGKKKRTEKYR